MPNDTQQQRDGRTGGLSFTTQQTPPLATRKVHHERKMFFLDLKENARGRFVKFTEDVGGRRDTVMIPMECLGDIIDGLTELEKFSEGNP